MKKLFIDIEKLNTGDSIDGIKERLPFEVVDNLLLMPQLPIHLIFTWRFRVTDGVPKFDNTPFQFALSFNITNR